MSVTLVSVTPDAEKTIGYIARVRVILIIKITLKLQGYLSIVSSINTGQYLSKQV